MYVAFHQGLHWFCLDKKLSSEKEIQFHLEIITWDSLIYTVDHPKLIIPKLMEESISEYRVKC